LKEKVKTMVPVTLIGEAKAVTEKLGMLLQTLSEVEIEALPDKLPDHLELNVESLAEVGQGLTVADIKVPEGVAILTDGEQQIVNVGALIVEEKVEEAPAPEEAAPAEEQAPAEGTAKTEEKPAETKPQGK